jgi:hypothetical protein
MRRRDVSRPTRTPRGEYLRAEVSACAGRPLRERENMRVAPNDSNGTGSSSSNRTEAKRPSSSHRPSDLIPLYDHEAFLFLVERERARADRAAARPPKAPRKRPVAAAKEAGAGAAAPAKGQPKVSSEGVWGATTDNREFSLVVFRPRARADRSGLVDLLQRCVRTTDAVGVIDTRRLGVLLPDTAAENALKFVKKVLTIADEQGVHLSHIVHTYPAAWPDEESPQWHEPKRSKDDLPESTATPAPQPLPRTQRQSARHSATNRGLMRGLVDWLQSAAFRRPVRRPMRASA